MMVTENSSQFGTGFTVSIDAKNGVTTGISASDRAKTILTAIHEGAVPSDLARPGHIFPLRAKEGGVLVRTGHTEGSVDLARIAGLRSAAVICEIMNDDGTMARMADLRKLATNWGIPIVSISDIVSYRLERDCLVENIAKTRMPWRYGESESEFEMHAFRSKL